MVEKQKESGSLNVINNKPWYKEGVHFHCTGCGACCQGEGLVILTNSDVKNMAKELKTSVDNFIKTYTQIVGGDLCLIDKQNSTDCIFLDDKLACTLYEGRPKQCRTFPFWKSVMRSKRCWDEEKLRCEGMDHPEGRHFSQEEIDKAITE